MKAPEIAATIRSLSKSELVTTLQRLHDKKGYLTTVTNRNEQTLLYYKQTPDQNTPSGVLWILGDEPPAKPHLSRLTKLQHEIGADHSAIATTVQPSKQPPDSSSELLTPNQLTSIISSLKNPTTVFPTSTSTTQHKLDHLSSRLKLIRPGKDLEAWSSTTTTPKPHAPTHDSYWDGIHSQ